MRLKFWVLCVFFNSEFGGSLDLAAVLEFVDSGHDLIIAADASASDLVRDIATECGVDFDVVSMRIDLVRMPISSCVKMLFCAELLLLSVFISISCDVRVAGLCSYGY